MWLSVADFFAALNYSIIGHHDNETSCRAQALVGIYFPVASFLWTDCIAWYLYQIIAVHSFDGNGEVEHPKLFPVFHLICWGVPGVIVIFVGSFGAEGLYDGENTGGWCWIEEQSTKGYLAMWELIGGKLVEWVSVCIFVPYLYITSAIRLRRIYEKDQSQKQKFESFTHRLILVPIIFFMIRVWGSILAIETFLGTPQITAISKLAAAFDPSQGFFNGLIFVFGSTEVREAMTRCCLKMCGKKRAMLPMGGSQLDPTCNGVTTNAEEDSRASWLLHRASQDETVYSTNVREETPGLVNEDERLILNAGH